VTQADIDAGTYLNTACVDDGANGAAQACDNESTPGTQNPAIHVVKSSTTSLITAAGQSVPYRFVVTNTGNITLTSITVTDPNCNAAPAYQSGDTNTDSKLQLTETWIYTCTHTVTAAEITTNGGGDGDLDNTVEADSAESTPDTDDYSIPIAVPHTGQITPTATTCSQFASGSAATLDTLSYSVKAGKINQVAPGVFFYWIRVTNGGTYTITQATSPQTSFTKFKIASGSSFFSSSCSKVNSTITQNSSTGTVTITFTGTGQFYIGIKYDTSSVKGATAPTPSTVHYTFAMTGVAGSEQSLDLVKK
jgi:hypothetical protein